MSELTIKLDEGSVDDIATAVVAKLRSVGVVTDSNPPSSETHTARNAGFSNGEGISPQNDDSDPWAAQPAPSGTSAPAPAEVSGSAPTTSPSSNDTPPSCKHGTRIRRPAGVWQSGPRKDQPYGPFYACPAARNAPDRCPSISVGA